MERNKLERAIQIVTDSSCDLPQQLLERFRIEVVPLMVNFGTETHPGGELSTDEFWEKADKMGSPQTSRPSVGTFEKVFERLVEQGKQVFCVMLTGKHSGTIETARLAAHQFGEAVQVFDSHHLSLGLGVQVLEAARAAEAGRSMEELSALLEDLRPRVHFTAVLDTLESVRRGGRADAFIAVVDRMARMLNIKPVLNFVGGEVKLLGAARSFRRALRRVLDTVEDLQPLERLAVVHAQNRERAEEMADQLAERFGFPREDIWVLETGAVLASHAGFKAVGILAVSARQPA